MKNYWYLMLCLKLYMMSMSELTNLNSIANNNIIHNFKFHFESNFFQI